MGRGPAKPSSEFMVVGRIRAPHGVRGELRVEVMTDFMERFAPGSRLFVEREEESRQVEAARPHKDVMLVKLEGLDRRSDVETLRGRYLLVPRGEAMPLPPDEYYEDELVGLRVETAAGEWLGEVVEVWWTDANEVYVLQGPYGEVLLPAIADVVREVDLEARKMIVTLLPGLLPAKDE
ncbi:MAG: 16S rRNA processing protein RimM [Caldilineae bacterium]|nr:MAG: 16S rRNA processing protein RimM [Caldilineae bacterium]